MSLVTRIFAALTLILALAAPVAAQDLSAEQQQALSDRIDSFDAAMKVNDMAGVMGVIPPAVLDKIAAAYGVTKEQLLEAVQQQLDEAMKTVTLVSFGMDVENAEIVTLPDGLTYALIPTETVIDLGEAAGGKMRSTSSTLGLLDGGTWYLVRVDDPQQVGIVKELYPGLVDLEFPASSVVPVTE